ncbi:MAG: hypothetical protein V3R74_05310 [Alphaproteobacteria bacterium]
MRVHRRAGDLEPALGIHAGAEVPMGEKQDGEDQAGQKSGSVPKVRWDDSNM